MNRRELMAALAVSVGYSLMPVDAAVAEERLIGISLIRLIANPGDFDAQRLRLTGYLANNGIDRALGLYVSEIDARNFIISNSVDIRVDGSETNTLVNKYVTLTGTYHAPAAVSSTYNGYLDHISNLRAWTFGDRK